MAYYFHCSYVTMIVIRYQDMMTEDFSIVMMIEAAVGMRMIACRM